jgi:hypothetical protein
MLNFDNTYITLRAIKDPKGHFRPGEVIFSDTLTRFHLDFLPSDDPEKITREYLEALAKKSNCDIVILELVEGNSQ